MEEYEKLASEVRWGPERAAPSSTCALPPPGSAEAPPPPSSHGLPSHLLPPSAIQAPTIHVASVQLPIHSRLLRPSLTLCPVPTYTGSWAPTLTILLLLRLEESPTILPLDPHCAWSPASWPQPGCRWRGVGMMSGTHYSLHCFCLAAAAAGMDPPHRAVAGEPRGRAQHECHAAQAGGLPGLPAPTQAAPRAGEMPAGDQLQHPADQAAAEPPAGLHAI